MGPTFLSGKWEMGILRVLLKKAVTCGGLGNAESIMNTFCCRVVGE